MNSFSLARRFAALALLASVVPAQVATNDVFDRPNSTDLGPDWVEVDPFGNAVIHNKQFRAANSLFGWALHTDYSAPYASTVVRIEWSIVAGGGDQISLIAGALATPRTWEGIEARLCDCDGDGLVESLAFNAAPNAGNWPGTGTYYNLVQPMAAGTMTMWFSNNGDSVHVELRDAATGATEMATASGILSFPYPPTGSGVGIGYFGNSYVDDFRAWTGTPAGPVLSLTTPRVGLPASYLITDATPNSAAGLYLSLTGAGPVPSPFGLVYLTPPIYVLATLMTDANGRAELPVGAIPPFPGLTLSLQGIDAGTLTLTNHSAPTIR